MTDGWSRSRTRLAPLSAGAVGRAADGAARLTCAYHGWRYDADGRCDLIPSLGRDGSISERARLRAAYGVAEAYGLVWLAPSEPLAALPAFPEWDAPGMTRARSRTVRTRASAGQLVDNFLDAAHFPFVHAASFGVADEGPLAAGSVTPVGWRPSSRRKTRSSRRTWPSWNAILPGCCRLTRGSRCTPGPTG